MAEYFSEKGTGFSDKRYVTVGKDKTMVFVQLWEIEAAA